MRQLRTLPQRLADLLQLFCLARSEELGPTLRLQLLDLPFLERTVLLVLLQEHFLATLEFKLTDIAYVFKEVGEGVRKIGFAPSPSLEENIEDSLLFDQVFCGLSGKALRDGCGLREVDSLGRAHPVLLDRSVVLDPHRTDHLGGRLKGLLEESSHVEVLREEEDVRHEVLGCLGKRKGVSELLVLKDDGPKDVPELVDGQPLPEDHFVEGFGHSSEHDLVPAHEGGVEEFIDERMGVEAPPQDVLADNVNEEGGDILSGVFLVLQKGVGVGVQPVLVGGLAGQCVAGEHVQDKQVYNGLLPRDGSVRVDQVHSVQPIVFHLAQSAFVGHEPLPGHVLGGVDLQKDEIGASDCSRLNLIVEAVLQLPRLCLGNPYESDLIHQVDVALVGPGQRFQLGGPLPGCAQGFPLVEKVVLGGYGLKAESAALEKSDHYQTYFIIASGTSIEQFIETESKGQRPETLKLKSKLSLSWGIRRAWSIRLRNQDQTSSIYVYGGQEGSASILLPMLSSFQTILTRESIELQRGLLQTVSFFSSERNTSLASRKARMLSQSQKVSRSLFQCSCTCEKRQVERQLRKRWMASLVLRSSLLLVLMDFFQKATKECSQYLSRKRRFPIDSQSRMEWMLNIKLTGFSDLKLREKVFHPFPIEPSDLRNTWLMLSLICSQRGACELALTASSIILSTLLLGIFQVDFSRIASDSSINSWMKSPCPSRTKFFIPLKVFSIDSFIFFCFSTILHFRATRDRISSSSSAICKFDTKLASSSSLHVISCSRDGLGSKLRDLSWRKAGEESKIPKGLSSVLQRVIFRFFGLTEHLALMLTDFRGGWRVCGSEGARSRWIGRNS